MSKALRFAWLSILPWACGMAFAGTVALSPAVDNGGGETKNITTSGATSERNVLQPLNDDGGKRHKLAKENKTKDPRLQGLMPKADKKKYPALRKRLPAPSANRHGIVEIAGLPTATSLLPQQKASVLKAAADGREIWGCLRASDTWTTNKFGFYKFNAKENPSFSSLMLFNYDTGVASYIYANAGSRLYNGMLDFVYIDTDYPDWYFFHYRINTEEEPWKVEVDREQLSDKALWALETATDNATGRVYGQFYNSSMSALEFGEIDYNTMTRTTISESQHAYVALGVTKDGVMYGVDDEANLYKISLTDGTETLVGATGLQLKVGDATYEQSGEIDQATGIFYWAAYDSQGKGALYTVDLTTGKAAKLTDFASNEQITALTLPVPLAEDGAPAAATNLSTNFEGGSLSGTVSFTAPTTTFGGDGSLDGTLDYTITDGTSTLTTGTATPGQTVDAPVSVSKSGQVVFTVTTSNAVGQSPKAKTAPLYIGFDVPKPVTELALQLDNPTGKTTLTWKASEGGLYGGYIGTIGYEVTRYPDNVVVATVSDGSNTFSETLPKQSLTKYYYGITPINGDSRGEEALSNAAIYGAALNPPYSETFENENSLDFFTIDDVNADGTSWIWYENQMKDLKCADYQYTTWDQEDGDDWLFTPPVHLKAGVNYDVSFKLGTWDKYSNERVEVKYGDAAQPEAMYGVIVKDTTYSTDDKMWTVTQTIKVDKDQDVFIGFHALTRGMDSYHLFVDDIKIEEGLSAAVPDSVENLTVVPAPNGEQAAIIKFVASSKNIDGQALDELTKVTIQRDDQVLAELTPKPGEAVEYKDTEAKTGANTYTVTPWNSTGEGRSLSRTSAYVGIDVPGEPQNAVAKDNTTAVRVEWSAPSEVGNHGGYVDVNGLTYSVRALLRGAPSELEGETQGTSFDIDRNTGEGEQEVVQYSVTAKNSAGESGVVYTDGLVVGKPYDLPFVESVPKGEMTSGLWWARKQGAASFRAVTSESADGDGGCLGLENVYEEGDVAYIGTGKLNLQAAESPKLVFSHYAESGTDHLLTAELQRPDGTAEVLKSIDYGKDQSLTGGWKTVVADLSAYRELPYVIIRFCAKTGTSYNGVYVDNVNIRNMKAEDVSVAIDAPDKAVKGRPTRIGIIVTNTGENTATNYVVTLKEGDKVIGTEENTVELAMSQSKTIEFDYTPSVMSNTKEAELAATVDYAPDQYTADNTATVVVATDDSSKPTPENVKAREDGQGGAIVEWGKPKQLATNVTEDFESYSPFIIKGIGDWETIDVDKGLVSGISTSLYYENQNKPFAFITFNPEYLDPDLVTINPSLKAHSGQQYMAALMSVDPQTKEFVDLDNWLISPTLSGEQQTISFYVSNQNDGATKYAEQFEVLYSTGGTTKDEFKKIGETHTVSGGTWELVSVELPAGATRFAIRQITDKDNSWLFRVDDVSYQAGAGMVTGYNIYRDGELLGNATASQESFTDAEVAEGSHTYAVTAVYADGESMPQHADPLIVTLIKGMKGAGNQVFDVYLLDGRLVGKGLQSLDQLLPGVYLVNGKKLVIE